MQVNNYSLVSAMEPRDDSDCSEEGEGEECEGDYTERQLVAEVISSASAARDEAAYVLDAAKGVSVEEGTGKKALIRCPAEVRTSHLWHIGVTATVTPGWVHLAWLHVLCRRVYSALHPVLRSSSSSSARSPSACTRSLSPAASRCPSASCRSSSKR